MSQTAAFSCEGEHIELLKRRQFFQQDSGAGELSRLVQLNYLGLFQPKNNPLKYSKNLLKQVVLTAAKELQNFNQENQSPNTAKREYNPEYLKEIEVRIEQLELEYYKRSSSIEIPEIQIRFEPEVEELSRNPLNKDLAASLMQSQDYQSRVKTFLNKFYQLGVILKDHPKNLYFKSIDQEAGYWKVYQVRIEDYIRVSNSLEYQLTISTLKESVSLSLKKGFIEDLGLLSLLASVKETNKQFLEINVKGIQQSSTLDGFLNDFTHILQIIQKLQQGVFYPTNKIQGLLDNFSQVTYEGLKSLYRNVDFQTCKLESFLDIIQVFQQKIIQIWNSQIYIIREESGVEKKKLNQSLMANSVKFAHNKFFNLLKRFYLLRECNQTLVNTAAILEENFPLNVSALSESNSAVSENVVKIFQQSVARISLMDLSEKSVEQSYQAIAGYEAQIVQIEVELARKMKELFASCKSQEEMIETLMKFQQAIQRPLFYSAAKQYIDQIVSRYQEKINGLIAKFKNGFSGTGSAQYALASRIMLPAGEHYWTENIHREIEQSMEKLESLLNQRMRDHETGKEIIRNYEGYQQLRKSQQSSRAKQ